MDDKTLDFLEEAIPELAVAALKQAYWQALAKGFSVLQSENGSLVEIHPDGTKTWVKPIYNEKQIPHIQCEEKE